MASALPGALWAFSTLDSQHRLQAFESACVGSGLVVVVLAGLTDGLLACPWVAPLSGALEELGTALVQPLLRSSFNQFGTGTLSRDVEDVCALLEHLRASRSLQSACLVGHSTGCQIIASLLASPAVPTWIKEVVRLVVLQGPVSDREALGVELETARIAELLDKARAELASGHANAVVHTIGEAPIFPQRCLDLFAPDGADDMFSSDLDDQQLACKLGHLAAYRALVCVSLEDEYVPEGVYPALASRLSAAIPGSTLLALAGADHAISDREQVAVFVQAVASAVRAAQEDAAAAAAAV